MKKRLVCLVLCLSLCLAAVPAAMAQEIVPATAADFDVPCQAAILIDEDTGTVLYEKNADEQRPIASITKVMTLLLTFEALEAGKISLEDYVPVSEHAYSMGGSQIWLEPGEQMTLNDMLKAICISSANDAAVAVAEYVGGSEPAFVAMMNEKAAELGMTGTHFENACGLDTDGHVSTARDVAIMSREMLLHHTEVKDYCMIWMDTLRDGATQLINTNKLLESYNGITGLKTGTTGKAGVCISASAVRGGLRLIAVVLGAPSSQDRFNAATALLDYGFVNYESMEATLPEDTPVTLPVEHGAEELVELEYTAPGHYLMPKDEVGELTAQITLPSAVQAPVAAGQQIGTVKISNNGIELASCPIVAAGDVAARSFGFCLGRLAQSLILQGENFVQNT
nr:D-alanyl-D-alanine carboxypeptidase family protein [uncultured Gemmiger sp.]